MITINKHADVNILTSRFWGVHGYNLPDIPIKL